MKRADRPHRGVGGFYLAKDEVIPAIGDVLRVVRGPGPLRGVALRIVAISEHEDGRVLVWGKIYIDLRDNSHCVPWEFRKEVGDYCLGRMGLDAYQPASDDQSDA